MLKLFKDWLTGIDGKTYDPSRAALLSGVLVFLTLAVWSNVKQHQKFDAVSFGAGFGAVLAAGGYGIKLKAGTEPKGDE